MYVALLYTLNHHLLPILPPTKSQLLILYLSSTDTISFYLFSTCWLNAELTDTDGQQSPPSLKYSAFTLPSNPQPGLPLCLVVFSFKYVRKWVTAQFKTQLCPHLSPSFQIMYFLLKVRFTKRQGKTKRKRSSICWFISRMAATANAGLGNRRCPWTLKTV